MKLDKSIIKRVISILFAFLLTLLLVAVYICAGFSFGIFNNSAITRKINESNYYKEVHKELNKSAEAFVVEAGLPISVLTNVISLERVYITGQNYVAAALSGSDYQIKTDKLRDALADNIYQYLMEEEIGLTQDLDSGIEELIMAIETDYKNGVQLKFLNYVMDYKGKFSHFMTYFLPILIVLIGVLCYFLIRMQKYAHQGVRYIVYAVISSSLLLILSASCLLLMKQYTRIDITPDYYRNFITAYLRWDITVFIYIGGIGITIALVLTSLISFLKSKVIADS